MVAVREKVGLELSDIEVRENGGIGMHSIDSRPRYATFEARIACCYSASCPGMKTHILFSQDQVSDVTKRHSNTDFDPPAIDSPCTGRIHVG